jgi:hypothetical protein
MARDSNPGAAEDIVGSGIPAILLTFDFGSCYTCPGLKLFSGFSQIRIKFGGAQIG